MLTEKPTVSIITVVYNGEKYLEQTIQSVIEQTYGDVEYIIIDGQSYDNTQDIIKKYENQINFWSSEPDEGIYDAMNKGLKKATGDIVGFLNADDWYELDAIESVVNTFSASQDLGFVFGDVLQINPKNNTKSTYRVRLNEAKRLMPFGHPGLFVKTKIHKTIPFDLSFKIAADYDLVLTLLDQKFTFQHLNKTVTNFRLEGVSSTEKMMMENYRVLKKHYGVISAIQGLSINLLLNNFWKLLSKFVSDKKITSTKLLIKKKLNVKS